MKAVVISEPGGPEVLQVADRPMPEPQPHEVRVRVAAAGVNRADLLQRRGHYPAPVGYPQDIPGLEYAGTIDMVGSEVDGWKVADRVMGITGGGAYAEYLTVDSRHLLHAPAELSLAECAAIPEAFITAWDALVLRLDVQHGERVLVHALASGVGTAALQLALRAGAEVWGTSRSAEKLERAAEIGSFTAVVADGNWVGEIQKRDVTFEAIVDLVGGDYVAGDLEVVAPLGRIAVVGLVAGASTRLDLSRLLSRRATLSGTVLRSRSADEKAEITALFAGSALPGFSDGTLRPVIDAIAPFEEAGKIHRRLEENDSFGKIVLSWSSGPIVRRSPV